MPPNSDLSFFVLKIQGVEYGGWFRVVAPDCIEVLAPGFMAILPLNAKSAEEVSCRALEDFIRGRLRVGAPVPAAAPVKETVAPDHTCDTRNATARK